MALLQPHTPSAADPGACQLTHVRVGPHTWRVDPPLRVPAGGYTLTIGGSDGGRAQIGAYGPDRQLVEVRDLGEPEPPWRPERTFRILL